MCSNLVLAADRARILYLKAASSDGALVDVAPFRVWVLEQLDDGMVGFFVMCFGVLVG